jgi:hypothetical protein
MATWWTGREAVSIAVLLALMMGLIFVCWAVRRHTRLKLFGDQLTHATTESTPLADLLGGAQFRIDIESEEWVPYASQPTAFAGVAWGRWGAGPDDRDADDADDRSIEMHMHRLSQASNGHHDPEFHGWSSGAVLGTAQTWGSWR